MLKIGSFPQTFIIKVGTKASSCNLKGVLSENRKADPVDPQVTCPQAERLIEVIAPPQ